MTIYGPGQVDPIPPDPAEPSRRPTNKWWAATFVGLATILVAWLLAPDGHDWSRTETALLVGFVAQRAAAYWLRNDDTPGGVPVKRVRDV